MDNIIVKPNVRSEKKYLISEAHYTILASLLNSTLKRDSNSNDKGEYYIRSLYFDTLDNKDYKEKQAALEKRQKIRLRIYNTNQKTVKLENKRKYGAFMIKHVTEISAEDAKLMMMGDYECLRKYNNNITDNTYAELVSSNRVPKVIVDYCREAYVEESMGFRINFDKNISAVSSYDMFNKDLALTPLQLNAYYVLEVKYSNYIPSHVQSILSSFNLIETTYSKYIYSRFNI